MAKRKRDLTMEQQLARGPMDLPFLMLVLLLTGIGVIMVFSASFATAYYEGRDPAYYFMRQALFAGAGLAIMYVISKINYQTFRWMSVFALGVAILLLIAVLIPGIHTNRADGVRRWIAVPGLGTFQPSEIAKVAVIMYFSARLSKRNTEKPIRLSPRSNLSGIVGWLDKIGFLELIPYGLILLVIVFLMKLEPHMSGTILILAGAAAVLFAAGIKFYWFLLGGGAMGLLLAISPPESWCGRTRGLTGRRAAIRSSSPCTPSAPAACWVWAWARAARNSSTCPSRKTTLSSPSSVRSWATSARLW